MAATAYEFNRMLGKLGKPIDRTEWGMGPQTVNAYYNPLLNEIVFPAAILQPPFFDANADEAVNYGGIGMVIGHELTHGFDDQGRQFDANGNLNNWWTKADEENFAKLSRKFVSQYNSYVPADSVHINGELTLGENIADLGGMIITYTAYKKATANKKDEKIGGLTADQRFFINFAQVWRTHYRPDALIQRLYTDPHSPPKYRVIGVLSNFPEFYTTFNVTEKNKMYIPDSLKCTMW
jgi:predicted metalloendopeptidase